jgi:hypothetical protein
VETAGKSIRRMIRGQPGVQVVTWLEQIIVGIGDRQPTAVIKQRRLKADVRRATARRDRSARQCMNMIMSPGSHRGSDIINTITHR